MKGQQLEYQVSKVSKPGGILTPHSPADIQGQSAHVGLAGGGRGQSGGDLAPAGRTPHPHRLAAHSQWKCARPHSVQGVDGYLGHHHPIVWLRGYGHHFRVGRFWSSAHPCAAHVCGGACTEIARHLMTTLLYRNRYLF